MKLGTLEAITQNKKQCLTEPVTLEIPFLRHD